MQKEEEEEQELVRGTFGGFVTDGPLWTCLFSYQIAVMSCVNWDNYLLQRNALWMSMGETDAFYLLWANFTASIIELICENAEAEAESKKQQLMSCNHSHYHARLEQIEPGTSYLLRRVAKYGVAPDL